MAHPWLPLDIPLPVLFGAALMLAAAAHDLAARTVPNWAAVGVLFIGVTYRLMDGRIIGGLVCGLVVFSCAAFCWRRGWMGGGDVKLMGAAAVLVPPPLVPMFIAALSIAGAVLALMYLAARPLMPAPARQRPRGLLARACRAEQWRISRGGPLPYACAIASGFLFVIL